MGQGFKLAISSVTIYEVLNNLPIKNIDAALSLVYKFEIFQINEKILFGATQLTNIYNKLPIEQHGISNEDKIIAATTILKGAYILTANLNDFPRPIFRNSLEVSIEYENKKKTPCLLVLQILEANGELIDKKLTEIGYL